MGNLKAKIQNFRFKGTLMIVLVFALIATILFIELSGVRFNYAQKKLDLLSKEKIVTKSQACSTLKKDTLILYSSSDKTSINAFEQFEVVLADMKYGTNALDLANEEINEIENYSVIIILFSDLSHVGEKLIDICNWVHDDGGCVYFPLTIDKNAYSSAIENRIGIEASYGYTLVDNIYVDQGFMIGGGKAYGVTDAYDSARTVQLNPKTTQVYAREGDKNGVPLIWKANYGEGEFVVNNFGMCDKAYRGFFAASLSLFGEVSLYPVINGSTFYLDDFPSQIPDGNSEYITRDFGTTIRDFYINIWWPDMMNLSDKYGIKYTGLAIECYDDAIDGTTDATPDTGTFLNFGNMLLRKGGEIGYHGYNHQPLALGRDYKGIYDYKVWKDYASMKKAFGHLVDFCDELFPDVNMSIYVPPSNLLAEEGREMLIKEFPHIKTLSGIYLPDDVLDFALLQEFEVDENGVVDQPRIISGCDLDDFMTMGAISELNMHYVNNHFTHPDDALDVERGAELGWKELRNRFDNYLNWLYTSAPNIRNFTGTEFSAAVQRFVAVAPKTQFFDDKMVIEIENFYDDAQFLIRFNEKKADTVTGGKLTHLTGNLYLLEADKDFVTISFI